MQKSVAAIPITRGRPDARTSRRREHPGQLLNSAALHFAQGRLLLCRALPSLSQTDAIDVRTLANAMQRVIVRLTRTRAA